MTPASTLAAKAIAMLVPRETTWAAAIDETSYTGERVLVAVANEQCSLVIDIPAASWDRKAALQITCITQPKVEPS